MKKRLTNAKKKGIIIECFGDMAQLVERLVRNEEATSSNLVISTIKTHAKGAYKTPLRVSFSFQNRGKLPYLQHFRPFLLASSPRAVSPLRCVSKRVPLRKAIKHFRYLSPRRYFSSVLSSLVIFPRR